MARNTSKLSHFAIICFLLLQLLLVSTSALKTIWNVMPKNDRLIPVCGSSFRACEDCDFDCLGVNEGRFPGPDCSTFFRCRNNRPCLVECPTLTMYDERSKNCVLRAFAKCNIDKREQAVTTRPERLVVLTGACNVGRWLENGVLLLCICNFLLLLFNKTAHYKNYL